MAEKGETATVFVYDTSTQLKKNSLSTPNVESQEYVSMAFAPGQEYKFLITLSGAPDYTLVYWHWERPKVSAFISVSTSPVYQISFNILDHSNGIIATGQNVFRGTSSTKVS